MNAGTSNNEITLLLLDLENALGSIPHNIIRTTLELIGFPHQFIKIIRDFYDGDTLNIFYNNQYSKEINY